MSATEELRADHDQVRRLQKVIEKCAAKIKGGSNIPFGDIEKITIIIYEFVDTIHHSREENSYFPCVASYDVITSYSIHYTKLYEICSVFYFLI